MAVFHPLHQYNQVNCITITNKSGGFFIHDCYTSLCPKSHFESDIQGEVLQFDSQFKFNDTGRISELPTDPLHLILKN